MAFLDTLIYGVKTILSGGVALTQRSKLNFHGGITAVDNPATGATDVSTGGNDIKASCRVATTGNITLSGAQTIDGVSVVAGDRVLVKAQSTGANNGIYVCAAGAWSRSTDADTSALVTSGMFTFVTEGTANDNTAWQLTTNDPIVLGTTALVFAQVGSGGVTSVSGTAPIVSSGGTTPAISITAASGGAAGSMAAADFSKLALYPAIGGLSTGAVLRATGAATAAFGQVDLADTDAVTGVLPEANQADQTLAGDVTGASGANTVTKIRGYTVQNVAPNTGEVLTWQSTEWVPTAPTAIQAPFLRVNAVAASDFDTIINNGVDGETITDAADGGVLFYRAGNGGAGLDLTGGMKAIPSGSAWTLTVGFAINIGGFVGSAGSDIGMGGIVLGDGTKFTLFGPLRYSGAFDGVSRQNWTDEDTYTATGKVETAVTQAGHPLRSAFLYGTPIYLQLRLRAGTIQFWWSTTGVDGPWVPESTLDVAVGAHLGTITNFGIGSWGYDAYSVELNLKYCDGIS